mmetsp:Transcript_14030/g.36062  ORF Transcript_14030/g.36062 Transcript_14030/m.36062 type:complete len:400 (-) Transcript_14030:1862-3061(-)|eukprot:CAMPEP_0113885868 /NCGR_PEP_ID=MMETSP0780_2-20120614/11188_1 /TAXON_ID=652834 /ORGANISM="Palpitomonas bilix" /LENGTH=399 /DNA_ID=CAMNT_0000873919 /DNA_START=139 /DNA_END=1338 /DNA_ORIENTATION=- /assembly_acc=CAM_ASM_000599
MCETTTDWEGELDHLLEASPSLFYPSSLALSSYDDFVDCFEHHDLEEAYEHAMDAWVRGHFDGEGAVVRVLLSLESENRRREALASVLQGWEEHCSTSNSEDSSAKVSLAYAWGHGSVAADPKRALISAMDSYQRGHPVGNVLCSKYMLDGKFNLPVTEAPVSTLIKTAESGCFLALEELVAHVNKIQPSRAKKLFRKASQFGSYRAMAEFALALLEGPCSSDIVKVAWKLADTSSSHFCPRGFYALGKTFDKINSKNDALLCYASAYCIQKLVSSSSFAVAEEFLQEYEQCIRIGCGSNIEKVVTVVERNLVALLKGAPQGKRHLNVSELLTVQIPFSEPAGVKPVDVFNARKYVEVDFSFRERDPGDAVADITYVEIPRTLNASDNFLTCRETEYGW